MPADKIVKFYHGASTNIQGKIDDGTINESDIVITADTDEIIYIDENKAQKPLGNSKSKIEHEVNLGSGQSVGGLETGDTIPEGTTLDELIVMLTQKAQPVSYTQPGITCRVSAGTAAGTYEVGTEINTIIQGLFTQNDAGAITNLEIKRSDVEDALVSGASASLTTDPQQFTLLDQTISFTATATYAAGEIKNNNLGQPDPTGQIQAGSKTSSAVSFIGKRNTFYGTGVGTAPEITSDVVRGLSGKTLGAANGTSFNITVSAGQQYVIIAYPSALRNLTKCFYVEQNTDLVDNFTQSTVSIEGANGATATPYKVYLYSMAVPAAAAMTLQCQI